MLDVVKRADAKPASGETDDAEIRVAALTGVPAFAAEKADWTRLAATSHLLIQHDWLATWQKAFAADTEFVILKATRGDKVLGYLPLLRYRSRWRRFPVTVLSLCANEHSTWGSLLLAPGQGDVVAQAFVRHLLDWRGWDVMQLPRLALVSTGSRHLLDGLLASGAGTMSRLEYQYVLQLPAQWEDYVRSLSRNFRSNLDSTRSKLAKMGTWAITVATERAEAQSAFEAFVDVDGRSWKKAAGETVASEPRARNYYATLVDAFSARGRCWIVLLRLDEKVISAAIFFEHNGTAYGLKSSSDAGIEAGTLSAGHLTVLRGFEEAHRRGLRRIHMLSGAATWARYKGELEPVLSGHAFNGHAYGRMVEFADRIATGLVKRPPATVPGGRRRARDATAHLGKDQG